MAFARLGSRARSPIVSEINITPLTDIFLVLLIIFMVTSAAMVVACSRLIGAMRLQRAGAGGDHGLR